jgi:hypothetical protein
MLNLLAMEIWAEEAAPTYLTVTEIFNMTLTCGIFRKLFIPPLPAISINQPLPVWRRLRIAEFTHEIKLTNYFLWLTRLNASSSIREIEFIACPRLKLPTPLEYHVSAP